VLAVLAGYLKILLMALLLLSGNIADIGWGVMDRPPESPTLEEGYLMSALTLKWMMSKENEGRIETCFRLF
jgi:hypothetical protein